MKCEGNCVDEIGVHSGSVRTVHVYDKNRDWGNFNYCENAVEIDIDRGFSVDVVEQQPTNKEGKV